MFLHFYAFQSYELIETHFFYKIFASAKRKPEGAKQPSSPPGLAGKFAERACKLVIKEGPSVCLYVSLVFDRARSKFRVKGVNWFSHFYAFQSILS